MLEFSITKKKKTKKKQNNLIQNFEWETIEKFYNLPMADLPSCLLTILKRKVLNLFLGQPTYSETLRRKTSLVENRMF